MSIATSPQRIWIITPCYNDVPSFLRLREDVLRELRAAPETAQIPPTFAVIDDTAGADPDIERLDALADVIVIRPPFSLGHQRGLVHGIRTLGPTIDDDDLVVTLDADGEDRPVDIPSLVRPLLAPDLSPQTVVLAARTRRQESAGFKIFYQLFRFVFRTLTGTTIRTGNFAAYHGMVAKGLLQHPHFDLCYSSSFISLDIPVELVPCPRGTRYAGQSRMDRQRLVLHGLRMLMPFMDRIAVRALGGLVALVAVAVTSLLTVAGIWLLSDTRIAGWLVGLSLVLVLAALLGIACCIILFALFAQSRGISLNNLEVVDARFARSASAQPN